MLDQCVFGSFVCVVGFGNDNRTGGPMGAMLSNGGVTHHGPLALFYTSVPSNISQINILSQICFFGEAGLCGDLRLQQRSLC